MLKLNRFLLAVFLSVSAFTNSHAAVANPGFDDEYLPDYDLSGYPTRDIHIFDAPSIQKLQPAHNTSIQSLEQVAPQLLAQAIAQEIRDFLLHNGIDIDNQLYSDFLQIIEKANRFSFVSELDILNSDTPTGKQEMIHYRDTIIISPIELLMTCHYFELALNKIIQKCHGYLAYLQNPEITANFLLKTFTGAFITAVKMTSEYLCCNSGWCAIPPKSYWEKTLSQDTLAISKTIKDPKKFRELTKNHLLTIEDNFLKVIDFDLYINPEDDFAPIVKRIAEKIPQHLPELATVAPHSSKSCIRAHKSQISASFNALKNSTDERRGQRSRAVQNRAGIILPPITSRPSIPQEASRSKTPIKSSVPTLPPLHLPQKKLL